MFSDPKTSPQTAKPVWDGLRWQYKYITLQQPVSGHMDAMGEDGWELVSAWPESRKDGLVCVFKRPRQND